MHPMVNGLLRLQNFSWDMSEINKFSKTAKPYFLRYYMMLVTWNCLIWPNCGFLNWLWRIKLWKNQLWRHFSEFITTTSPKQRNKIFPFWALPSRILGYANVHVFEHFVYRIQHEHTRRRTVWFRAVRPNTRHQHIHSLIISNVLLLKISFCILWDHSVNSSLCIM